MKIQTGSILKNRYRVDALLGRGGMAEVYQVFDLQRGVPLAMKVLREDLAEDRVFLRRFQREARNLSKLQHPNIVRFYGLEQEGRLALILMEYIEGTTLRGLIFDAKGPLPHQQVLEIMQPVCSALHYAHQQGIVHCDLKSANIMLDKNGKVYLTDFGIVRMTDMATSTMVGIGTPAYMAPELIQGQDPTPQTDIYALGILLFEMYTGGERPFTGERAQTTGTTADKVRWEHLHSEPALSMIAEQKECPDIKVVIGNCLRKEPRERFDNVTQLIQTLNSETTINEEDTLLVKKIEKKIGEKDRQVSIPREKGILVLDNITSWKNVRNMAYGWFAGLAMYLFSWILFKGVFIIEEVKFSVFGAIFAYFISKTIKKRSKNEFKLFWVPILFFIAILVTSFFTEVYGGEIDTVLVVRFWLGVFSGALGGLITAQAIDRIGNFQNKNIHLLPLLWAGSWGLGIILGKVHLMYNAGIFPGAGPIDYLGLMMGGILSGFCLSYLLKKEIPLSKMQVTYIALGWAAAWILGLKFYWNVAMFFDEIAGNSFFVITSASATLLISAMIGSYITLKNISTIKKQ